MDHERVKFFKNSVKCNGCIVVNIAGNIFSYVGLRAVSPLLENPRGKSSRGRVTREPRVGRAPEDERLREFSLFSLISRRSRVSARLLFPRGMNVLISREQKDNLSRCEMCCVM